MQREWVKAAFSTLLGAIISSLIVYSILYRSQSSLGPEVNLILSAIPGALIGYFLKIILSYHKGINESIKNNNEVIEKLNDALVDFKGNTKNFVDRLGYVFEKNMFYREMDDAIRKHKRHGSNIEDFLKDAAKDKERRNIGPEEFHSITRKILNNTERWEGLDHRVGHFRVFVVG